MNLSLQVILKSLSGVFNQKNLDSGLKSFDKFMSEFNKGMSDFGNAMGKMDSEFKDDIRKSDNNRKVRERIDKENLEKIWGKKK